MHILRKRQYFIPHNLQEMFGGAPHNPINTHGSAGGIRVISNYSEPAATSHIMAETGPLVSLSF